MATRVPPNSQQAEESVVGAILIDPEAITLVAQSLQGKHFYDERLGQIYGCCLDIYERREPIDVVTLSEELKKKKLLTEVGGRARLAKLVEETPSSANVENYAKIIRDNAIKRELIHQASRLIEAGFDETKTVDSILDAAEQRIFSLAQKHFKKNFISVGEALADSFDRLDELHKHSDQLRGVPTGFRDLDRKLAGLQRSNLIILAARPGMGKTALSLNIAQEVAVRQKLPVGFFSLEMSQEELVDRLLVAQADIDAWKIKTGRLTEADFGKLSEAMGELAEAPLYIDDTPGSSILEMRTKARRLISEQGLKLIVVDYLQLIVGGRYENRVQEVSEISQGLKNLARELQVPILALSQLNRAVESRGVKRPQLADLRESGAIEQDADVVMFLYREGDDEEEGRRGDASSGQAADSTIMTRLSIAKHRNGPLGLVDLLFRGDRIRFYGVESRRK